MGTIAMQGPRGSGKTSLGEAVSRAVFGIPQKALGKMSFKRKGNTYVCVEGTLGDKPFTVETGYKCEELGGTGEGLRFTVDGIPTQRADIKDTRSELNAVLGISQELTMWTVFLNGDKLDFGGVVGTGQGEALGHHQWRAPLACKTWQLRTRCLPSGWPGHCHRRHQGHPFKGYGNRQTAGYHAGTRCGGELAGLVAGRQYFGVVRRGPVSPVVASWHEPG